MGQHEVLEFLKKHTGWFTSTEISKALDISIGSVTASLKKLREADMVDFKNQGRKNKYIYTARS